MFEGGSGRKALDLTRPPRCLALLKAGGAGRGGAALDQLLRHGLVRPTEAAEALPQSYVALPIHKAVASLREVWGSEKLRPNLEATCGASGARGGAPALALLLASAPNLRGRGDSTSEELSPVRRAPFRRGSETSTRRE